MLQAPVAEHESIVVHTTTARSVMMDNLTLPEGRKATVPVTLNETGTIVSVKRRLYISSGSLLIEY